MYVSRLVLVVFAAVVGLSGCVFLPEKYGGPASEVITIDSDDPEAPLVQYKVKSGSNEHAKRGVKYIGLDKLAEAVRELEAAAAAEPDDANVQFILGLAHEKAGDLAKAVKAYEAAYMLKSDEWYRDSFKRAGGAGE